MVLSVTLTLSFDSTLLRRTIDSAQTPAVLTQATRAPEVKSGRIGFVRFVVLVPGILDHRL